MWLRATFICVLQNTLLACFAQKQMVSEMRRRHNFAMSWLALAIFLIFYCTNILFCIYFALTLSFLKNLFKHGL